MRLTRASPQLSWASNVRSRARSVSASPREIKPSSSTERRSTFPSSAAMCLLSFPRSTNWLRLDLIICSTLPGFSCLPVSSCDGDFHTRVQPKRLTAKSERVLRLSNVDTMWLRKPCTGPLLGRFAHCARAHSLVRLRKRRLCAYGFPGAPPMCQSIGTGSVCRDPVEGIAMRQNGIHHVTAIAGDARRNFDFYTRTLGLRFVKKTVNFDDPGTYHFYYGDESGRPGTILTFFPWQHVAPGRVGVGQTQETAFRVPEAAIGYWAH